MHASLRKAHSGQRTTKACLLCRAALKELGARHSLLNLSVHDLVEEFARYVSLCFALLTGPFLSANANVLKEVMLLCRTIKLLSIPSADKYSKKHLKVREADALKQVDANVREGENKNRSSLYYFDSNSDTATRKMRIKARARLIKRQRLESEAQLRKASKEEDTVEHC
ncbi:hypothetical protein HBI17_235980 [Parastagonospora nodorum]|nr:hypothetical protein HBI17_235980 [Parastagonospora nodorum]